MPDPVRPVSEGRTLTSRVNALFDAKLTPSVALLFFVALAVLCAAAAGIGYLSQALRHAGH